MKIIQFDYKYRDAGNNKWFGSIFLSNENAFSLQEIENKLRKLMISEEFFESSILNLPHLCTASYDPELDHSWYEFESVEFVDVVQDCTYSLDDFLTLLEKQKVL